RDRVTRHGRPCYVFRTVAPHDIVYTLSLHDALPILQQQRLGGHFARDLEVVEPGLERLTVGRGEDDREARRRDSGQVRDELRRRDRKSTRLNSSHLVISYAVFCLKQKIMSSRSLASA